MGLHGKGTLGFWNIILRIRWRFQFNFVVVGRETKSTLFDWDTAYLASMCNAMPCLNYFCKFMGYSPTLYTCTKVRVQAISCRRPGEHVGFSGLLKYDTFLTVCKVGQYKFSNDDKNVGRVSSYGQLWFVIIILINYCFCNINQVIKHKIILETNEEEYVCIAQKKRQLSK